MSGSRFRARTLVAVATVVAAAAGAGGYFAGHGSAHASAPGPSAGASSAPVSVTRYTCPMHPSVIQDHPGRCPLCGMALVPMKEKPKAAAPTAGHGHEDRPPGERVGVPGLALVTIDPERQQLIGLRTAPVERTEVGGTWQTVGRVAFDETRIRTVTVKVPVYVEQVVADFIGKKVARGAALFSGYSPDILAAQDQYLIALQSQAAFAPLTDAGAPSGALVEAARRKLELWDVPKSTISKLERTGKASRSIVFHSPIAGVVTERNVFPGTRLEPGAIAYQVVDLTTVWVLADIYENELARVEAGMSAELALQAYPGRRFDGKVAFIDPVLDAGSRTAKARLAFQNPDGALKPEMYGKVTLTSKARTGLAIPDDAIIDSGQRKVVFVALGDGKFEPREIVPGVRSGERVEVLSGLDAGERVVTRANFLIDSESRLRASLAQTP
ncbi:MAG: efflux RND transporter periplasmic adaptor subunit [Sorangiineae bacterium]|nr:efflux RND transporter periplasmic adaptor subunit [Polyangiaceae bacterium]MEB2324217.1 efflux RND transporter periplasmic adaptor subunit [Sorangiineae bacterium]